MTTRRKRGTVRKTRQRIAPKTELDAISRRFRYNIARVQKLVSFYDKLKAGGEQDCDDLLHAAVVLLHASLEDAFRSVLVWKAVTAKPEHVKETQFLVPNGRDDGSTATRKEITFVQLFARPEKTKDELVRTVVREHFERQSFNHSKDFSTWFMMICITETPSRQFDPLVGKLNPMIKRRHQIAHRSDRMDAVTGEHHGKKVSLSKSEVEGWVEQVEAFISPLLQLFMFEGLVQSLKRMKDKGLVTDELLPTSLLTPRT